MPIQSHVDSLQKNIVNLSTVCLKQSTNRLERTGIENFRNRRLIYVVYYNSVCLGFFYIFTELSILCMECWTVHVHTSLKFGME